MYLAVGWAGGTRLTVTEVVATGERFGRNDEFATLWRLRGMGFPGMSGGFIVRRSDMKAVGVVNAGSIGVLLSRPLAETAVCRGGI